MYIRHCYTPPTTIVKGIHVRTASASLAPCLLVQMDESVCSAGGGGVLLDLGTPGLLRSGRPGVRVPQGRHVTLRVVRICELGPHLSGRIKYHIKER